MTTIAQTKARIQRQLADYSGEVEHAVPIAVVNIPAEGPFRALIISRGRVTAGVLLMPADWQDPVADCTLLPHPVDEAGWRLLDILHEAGITDVRNRAEPD